MKPVLTIEKVDDETFLMTTITPKGSKTLTIKGSEDQTEIDLTKVEKEIPKVSFLSSSFLTVGSLMILPIFLCFFKTFILKLNCNLLALYVCKCSKNYVSKFPPKFLLQIFS